MATKDKKKRAQIKDSVIIVKDMSQAFKEYVDTGKLPKELFEALEQKDPSVNKKYTSWICKRFIEENLTFVDLRRLECLKEFQSLCNRGIIKPPMNDIGRYKTVESLVDAVIQNSTVKTRAQEKKEVKQEGSKLIYENTQCMVYEIITKEASMFYGSGTKWCTAASSHRNYFDNYYHERSANLRYIVPKGSLLKSVGKVAVAPYHKTNVIEFYNAEDKSLSVAEFKRIAAKLELPFREEKEYKYGR